MNSDLEVFVPARSMRLLGALVHNEELPYRVREKAALIGLWHLRAEREQLHRAQLERVLWWAAPFPSAVVYGGQPQSRFSWGEILGALADCAEKLDFGKS